MRGKKAQAPPLIDILPKILIASVALIIYMIIIFNMSSISIDDKRLKTQLVENSILNKNCFSDTFATIKEEKFTNENVKSCFGENVERTSFLIELNGKNLYLNKDLFDEKINFCSLRDSNVKCTTMQYPVNFISKTGEQEILKMTVHTIIT